MASSSSGSQSQLSKFTVKNYEHWKIQMKVIFKFHDVWEIVEQGYEEPTPEVEKHYLEEQKKQLDQLRNKDLKALSFLHQAVDESVFEKIAAVETSYKVWSILEKVYHSVTWIKNVKLQYLRMEFEILKMKPSEIVLEFFDRVTAIRNNMKALDENIEDKIIVQKILRSMTPKFEQAVFMLEERATPWISVHFALRSDALLAVGNILKL